MILLNNLHNMESLSLSDLVLSTPILLISFGTSICCSPSGEIPIVNWMDEQLFFTAKRYGLYSWLAIPQEYYSVLILSAPMKCMKSIYRSFHLFIFTIFI